MTTSTHERRARAVRPTSNVISVRDFLLRRSEALAARCPTTQRIRAFADTLPTGITPDEADAMVRAHLSTFTD